MMYTFSKQEIGEFWSFFEWRFGYWWSKRWNIFATAHSNTMIKYYDFCFTFLIKMIIKKEKKKSFSILMVNDSTLRDYFRQNC